MMDDEVAALVVDNGSGMCKVRIFSISQFSFFFESKNFRNFETEF